MIEVYAEACFATRDWTKTNDPLCFCCDKGNDYPGTLTALCALKIAPQVFACTGELHNANDLEIDFDQAEAHALPGHIAMRHRWRLTPTTGAAR